MADINNTEDVIYVSDITDRVDELREERGNLEDLQADVESAEEDITVLPDDATEQDRLFAKMALEQAQKALKDAEDWEENNPDEAEELHMLESLLDDIKGYGEDHQWEGCRYPGHLIRYSYFTEYCKDLVRDVGDLPKDIPVYIVIDWEATADNIRMDYGSVDFDGVEYLYR